MGYLIQVVSSCFVKGRLLWFLAALKNATQPVVCSQTGRVLSIERSTSVFDVFPAYVVRQIVVAVDCCSDALIAALVECQCFVVGTFQQDH